MKLAGFEPRCVSSGLRAMGELLDTLARKTADAR
jgi:hypothetical protein